MAGVTLDGVPASALARRWGVPRCQVLSAVGSALDVIHDWGESGAPAGSIVVAVEQTAGRGRDGRTWFSPEGGVWFALLLRPPAGSAASTLGIVSIRVGLIVADVVDELLGIAATRLKWPNDVLLRDRKLAGVLCEGRWQGDALQWLGVGLGMNVANEIPAPVRSTAIALAESLPGIRPLAVLDRLVPPLARLGTPTSRLSEQECTAFASRDWLLDRTLLRPVAGRAVGVREDGALLVAVAGRLAAVREGHVETSAA